MKFILVSDYYATRRQNDARNLARSPASRLGTLIAIFEQKAVTRQQTAGDRHQETESRTTQSCKWNSQSRPRPRPKLFATPRGSRTASWRGLSVRLFTEWPRACPHGLTPTTCRSWGSWA